MDYNRLGQVPQDRRAFLRGVLVTGAVAVPVVTTIQLAGVMPAAAQVPNISGVAPTPPAPTTPAPTPTPTPPPSPTPSPSPSPQIPQ